jgi:hypothetical protein
MIEQMDESSRRDRLKNVARDQHVGEDVRLRDVRSAMLSAIREVCEYTTGLTQVNVAHSLWSGESAARCRPSVSYDTAVKLVHKLSKLQQAALKDSVPAEKGNERREANP